MTTLTKTGWVALQGTAQQGGPKNVLSCEKCGGLVVWAESKNGKFYLADVFQGISVLYYVKASPHFKSCEDKLAIKEEANKHAAELERWVAETDLRNFLFGVRFVREGLAEGRDFQLPDWWQKEYEAD